MICMGYDAGYITADQAWPQLLENARLRKPGFIPWQEFGDNFLDSREAGAGERDPQFGTCVQMLENVKELNSPWNQLPWATNLGSSDTPPPSAVPPAPPPVPTNSAP